MSESSACPIQNGGAVAGVVSAALVALLLGALPYLSDRPPGTAWLIPTVASFQGLNLFGPVGAWLPSFAHAFGFALLSAAVLPARALWLYGACVAWFAVNALFELGQMPRVAPWLAEAIGSLLGPSVLAQRLGAYFVGGSFAVDDLVAAAAGACCAALFLRLTLLNAKVDHAH
jgi:hypothetical protein